MDTSSGRAGVDLTLLHHRPFALLLGARTASMLASAFAPVALAFGVLSLPGAGATTLSVVLASEAVPLVVFMLVGGVIADRMPRQRVMMIGDLMNAAAFSALGYMLLSHHAPVIAMAAAAALTGIGMAMLFPALTGIIPEVVPGDRLQTGNAVLALGPNTARIAGIVVRPGGCYSFGVILGGKSRRSVVAIWRPVPPIRIKEP